MSNSNQPRSNLTWEKIVAIVLAIVVLSTFIFYIFNPPATADATLALIRFLAAAFSGLAAFLFVGDLNLEGTIPGLDNKFKVKAAGGFATFLLIFFLFYYGIPSDHKDESNFDKLEKYLQSHKWKEADKETTSILKEKAGNQDTKLKKEDIEKISCNDLFNIDKLWIEHSQKKFGFSVQTKIYKDKLNSNSDNAAKAYEEFFQTVGWKINGNWVEYKNLIFDLNRAPTRHLPHGGKEQYSSQAIFEHINGQCHHHFEKLLR